MGREELQLLNSNNLTLTTLLPYLPSSLPPLSGMSNPRHDYRAPRGLQEGQPPQDGSLGLLAYERTSLV